jgi:hypothetical protein
MSAVLPHYEAGGPWSKQVAGLIYGGQWVEPNTQTPGTTDLTVKVSVGGSSSAGALYVLGVAGTDANVVTTQTGGANSYGQPLIDISVLTDYCSVFASGWDIWCWFGGQAVEGEQLVVGAASGVACAGTVCGVAHSPCGGSSGATSITPAYGNIVGRCTTPGGVSSAMLTQQIGGQGAASYYLGRVRLGF